MLNRAIDAVEFGTVTELVEVAGQVFRIGGSRVSDMGW